MVNNSDDHGLRLSRTLPAPPATVWRALTDPAALAAWFWPRRHTELNNHVIGWSDCLDRLTPYLTGAASHPA